MENSTIIDLAVAKYRKNLEGFLGIPDGEIAKQQLLQEYAKVWCEDNGIYLSDYTRVEEINTIDDNTIEIVIVYLDIMYDGHLVEETGRESHHVILSELSLIN
jgi:hypothetical protein